VFLILVGVLVPILPQLHAEYYIRTFTSQNTKGSSVTAKPKKQLSPLVALPPQPGTNFNCKSVTINTTQYPINFISL
jgi:hypothetical protein